MLYISQVRKWLARIQDKRKEPPNWQRPPGLSDERRVELLERITAERESRQVATQGAEKREELHMRVQAMLKTHAIGSKKRRKDEMHRNALLARLDTDAQLLIREFHISLHMQISVMARVFLLKYIHINMSFFGLVHIFITSFAKKRLRVPSPIIKQNHVNIQSHIFISACPKLSEVQPSDLKAFVCHSVPVATAARHNHTQELRLLRQPWWKKLGDEYQDKRMQDDMADWRGFHGSSEPKAALT